MLDFLFELIFQVVFEIVVDWVVQLGWSGLANVMRSRLTRNVVSATIGFGLGVWWGAHLAAIGHAHRPRLFWVSIAIATVAVVAAVYRRRHPENAVGVHSMAPWTWPSYRWVGLAILNVAVAAGVATGWHPPVIG